MQAKRKNIWDLLGFVVGLAMILAGIVFLATPADTYSTRTPDSASFGADFYTYQYDATRAAAQNAAVTANNLRELGGKLAAYSGTFFLAAGALTAIHYGKRTFVPKEPGEAPETPVPPEEIPPVEAEAAQPAEPTPPEDRQP